MHYINEIYAKKLYFESLVRANFRFGRMCCNFEL